MKKELRKEIEKEKDKINYKILFLNMLFESENALIIKNGAYNVKNNDLMNLFNLYKNAGLFRKVYKGESI